MVAKQERHHSEETEQPVEHSTRSTGTAHDSVDLRSPDDSDTIKKRMQLPANEESHTLTQGFEVGSQAGQSPAPASDTQSSQPTAQPRLVSPLLTGLLRASNDDSVSGVLSPASGKRVDAEATHSKGEGAIVSAAERLSLGVVNADPAHPVDAPGKPIEGTVKLVDAGVAPGSIGSRIAPADKSPDTPSNSVAVNWARTNDTAYNVADTSGRAAVRSMDLSSDNSVGSDKPGAANSATTTGDKGWKPDFGVNTGDKGWKPEPLAVARDTGVKVETGSQSDAAGWKVVDSSQTRDAGGLGVADAKPGAYNKVVDNLAGWALNEVLQRADRYLKVDGGNVGSKPIEIGIGTNIALVTGEKRGWVDKPGVDKPGVDKPGTDKPGTDKVFAPLPGGGTKEKRDDFQKPDSLDVRKPQFVKVVKPDREESTLPIKPHPGRAEPLKLDLEKRDVEPKAKLSTMPSAKDESPSKLDSNAKLVLPAKLELPAKPDLLQKLDLSAKLDLPAKLDLRIPDKLGVGQKDSAVDGKTLVLVASIKELTQDRPQRIKEFQQRLDLVFIGKAPIEADRKAPQDKVERPVLSAPPDSRIHTRLELLEQTRRTLGESKFETGTRRNEPQEFRVIDRTIKGVGEIPQIKREDLLSGRREGKVEQPGEPRPGGKIEMQIGKKEIDGAKKEIEIGKKGVELEIGTKVQFITPKGPGAITEEETAKKKGKKQFGEDEEDANLQLPPEDSKKKPDEETPQVVLTQSPLLQIDNKEEKEQNQAQALEDELDAEERRQRNLAILAASNPNSNDPNQSQQSQTNPPTSGNCSGYSQIDPSTVLPTIELTDQTSTVLPVQVEPSVEASVHAVVDQSFLTQQASLQSEIEQRYDIEMDAYAAHAATIQGMRERELLGYEMREEEQRQERERLTEERNARCQRELEENDRRMAALLAQKRKAAQVASDKMASSRVTYVIQPGDTLESIARRMLADKRLSGLIFDLNRTAIPWRIESGRRYLALKPGLAIQLPNHVDITRYKASKRTTTLPFGYEATGTTSSDTTTALPSEQAARQKARRNNVEKILGPLTSSDDEPADCIARLGETLNSLARRHPLLKDESLWPLLAEVNSLSQETDAVGRAKARLTRGAKLRLPSSEQILEFQLKRCQPDKTTEPDAAGGLQTTIAENRRDVLDEYVFLDQNIRLLIARDRSSMNEVQYYLQIFVADWQCVRSYEESYAGNWIRHQYDRFGAVKSFALDLPVLVIKELARNDLYGAWEGYVNEYLAISATKTA